LSGGGRQVRFGRPDWPLWKVIPVVTLVYLVFSALLLGIPPFLSRSAFVVGSTLVLLGLASVLWARYRYSRWAEVLGNFILPLQLLAAASRGWMYALPIHWALLIPLWAAFLLAAALPVMKPRLSRFLWLEQVVPQTALGQALMALCLALAPAAGMLGASWGQYGVQYLGRHIVWLGGAILFSAMAIGFAFHSSYVMVDRLWAKAASDRRAPRGG